jgi:hypothetical protein
MFQALYKEAQHYVYNDIYARHHRGSSPSFEEGPTRRLEDWMRSCRSLDQHPYSLSEIQSLRQCVVPRIEFKHREPDSKYFPNEEYLGNE